MQKVFNEFLQGTKHRRHLAFATRLHKEVYRMYKNSDSDMPYLDWLIAHKDEVLAFITALLKLWGLL